MQNKALKITALCVCLAASGNAFSKDPTFGELSAVQSETILLKAQVEREEAILKIKKLKDSKTSEDTPKGISEGGMTPMTNLPQYRQNLPVLNQVMTDPKSKPVLLQEVKVEPAKTIDLPILRGVVGGGKKLFATLSYSYGDELEVTIGDTLPGDYRVISIAVDKVILNDKNGKRHELIKSTRFKLPVIESEAQKDGQGIVNQRPSASLVEGDK